MKKVLIILAILFLCFAGEAEAAPTFITPVEITPGTSGAWIDADVSASVPAGATGVILHIVNNTGGADRPVGFRKNGSTDARIEHLYANLEHFWVGVGVDASRILELYVSDTTLIDIWLVGYFTSEAVFFTNGIDKVPTTIGAWTDISIAADTGANTAVGAFFEITAGVTNTTGGIRNNGSTDNRTPANAYQRYWGSAVIGVDATEICEGYIGAAGVHFWLLGYIMSQATFNVNATDISLGVTAAWTDLTALPAEAIGGIIEGYQIVTADYYYGLRKNGSTENIYGGEGRHPWGIVEADASRLIEGKISDLALDFFLTGYFTTVVAAAAPEHRTIIIE